MTKIQRSGTSFTFPLALGLPKADPLPEMTIFAPLKVSVTLKRTDPKSEVGAFILNEFESLLRRSIDQRLKPRQAAVTRIWQAAAAELKTVKDAASARKIAATADRQAKKELTDLLGMLETDAVNASLTLARKKAEKHFKAKLGEVEQAKMSGKKKFLAGAELGRQIATVGLGLLAVATGGGSAAAVGKGLVTLWNIYKNARGAVENTVKAARQFSKERAAKLRLVKSQFDKCAAALDDARNQMDSLAAQSSVLSSAVSSATNDFDKLERATKGLHNLNLDKSQTALIERRQAEIKAGNKILDQVGAIANHRSSLNAQISSARKEIDKVVAALDKEMATMDKTDSILSAQLAQLAKAMAEGSAQLKKATG